MNTTQEKFKIRVAGCFLEYDGRFLILHRFSTKSQGGKWGLPAGKVEKEETGQDAIIREVFEETGFQIPLHQLEYLQEIRWDFPEKIVEFVVYRIKLTSPIEVILNQNEHQAFAWVTGKECYARNDLMHGVRDLLEKVGYASNEGEKIIM
jgi:mutator protein MutT